MPTISMFYGIIVRVSFDTIEWDAGVDLAPEFVYSKSQRSAAEKVTTVTA